LTMMLMLNLICALHCTYRATTAESCRWVSARSIISNTIAHQDDKYETM
jgi:hypothetical protein